MKADYINSFIEASQLVLKMICSIDAKLGKIYLKNSPFSVNQVIIMIGLVGEIRGQVYLELPVETAKKIASIMMGGIPIAELDEMGKSAVSEMGNMIMGNACTILANKKIQIDITPPSLLTGDNIEISNKHSTIVVPLELQEFGIINFNIVAEEVQ